MQTEKQIRSSRFDAAATIENHSNATNHSGSQIDTLPDTPSLQTQRCSNQSNRTDAVCTEAAGLSVLMVTGIEGATHCAHAMAALLGNGANVEVAANRREALVAMRKRDYSVLVVEESLAECDPNSAEQLWQNAGGAMPIQVNFALWN